MAAGTSAIWIFVYVVMFSHSSLCCNVLFILNKTKLVLWCVIACNAAKSLFFSFWVESKWFRFSFVTLISRIELRLERNV